MNFEELKEKYTGLKEKIKEVQEKTGVSYTDSEDLKRIVADEKLSVARYNEEFEKIEHDIGEYFGDSMADYREEKYTREHPVQLAMMKEMQKEKDSKNEHLVDLESLEKIEQEKRDLLNDPNITIHIKQMEEVELRRLKSELEQNKTAISENIHEVSSGKVPEKNIMELYKESDEISAKITEIETKIKEEKEFLAKVKEEFYNILKPQTPTTPGQTPTTPGQTPTQEVTWDTIKPGAIKEIQLVAQDKVYYITYATGEIAYLKIENPEMGNLFSKENLKTAKDSVVAQYSAKNAGNELNARAVRKMDPYLYRILSLTQPSRAAKYVEDISQHGSKLKGEAKENAPYYYDVRGIQQGFSAEEMENIDLLAYGQRQVAEVKGAASYMSLADVRDYFLKVIADGKERKAERMKKKAAREQRWQAKWKANSARRLVEGREIAVAPEERGTVRGENKFRQEIIDSATEPKVQEGENIQESSVAEKEKEADKDAR